MRLPRKMGKLVYHFECPLQLKFFPLKEDSVLILFVVTQKSWKLVVFGKLVRIKRKFSEQILLQQPPPLVAYFQKNVSGEKLSQKRQKRMATFLIEIVENYPKQMNKFSFKFLFSFHRGHRLHKDFLTEHSER